jgi:glutamyl-tRNA reductase
MSSQNHPAQKQAGSITTGLITLGLNHKTAPVELRERLAFTPQSLPEALDSLIQLDGVEEAAILSTCNRTELYCATRDIDDQQLLQWFSQFHGMQDEPVTDHCYVHQHQATIRHAMEVASGLDSMVLGEPQIAGQMKDAYAFASTHGTVGQMLGKLFQHAFAVAKQVRTDTAIGSSPVSVAFAAVSLAKQIFGELDSSTALLIGAGDTIELTSRHLEAQHIQHMIVANRSVDRAQLLAEQFGAEAISLQHISDHLHKADIVISSTASPLPILGKGTVERALKKRKHEPMFMVDLAVPRDIEGEIAELDDVYLYTVDDLHEVIDENLQSRQQASAQAQEIIDEQVLHFLDWQRALGAVDVITEIRQHANELSDEVLHKARKQLAAGQSAEQVLEFMAQTLTNKFLHTPSIRLREASQNEKHELVKAARELLLQDNKDDRS